MKSYLAYDLGASSGRLMLGMLDKGILSTEEVYRFPNNILDINGHSHWNIFQLFTEMKKGLEIFIKSGREADSMAIDTWGVDFVLLGSDGTTLGLPFAYRDCRYNGIMEKFAGNIMPLDKLYSLTGLQMMQFNSIFQLYALKLDNVPTLGAATDLLYIADYLNYLFCGARKNEFTFASTSQLLDPITREYNPGLFRAIGVDPGIAREIVMPGSVLGEVNKTIRLETGVGPLPVIAVASHDTGSAIAAVPAGGENWAYLSLGTWGLMGTELKDALITEKTFGYNFTNEGGVNGTYRFLKNITGLWLIEQCKRSWAGKGKNYSYDQIVEMATEASAFERFIDPDAPSLMNPPDMPAAIEEFCVATGQTPPRSDAETVRLILESLAMKYKYTFNKLRDVSPKPLEKMHIIGGGSKNRFLCKLTADALGVQVVAGPAEATAVGNLLVQAMAMGQLKSLDELRKVVRDSFDLSCYDPHDTPAWDKAFGKFMKVTNLK
jgi:rhamnulokinase